MAYLAAYQDPDFAQGLAPDVAWLLIGDAYFGALRYVDPMSGRQAVVPNLPYNQPPAWRAKAFRYYADVAEKGAGRLESQSFPKSWELSSAARQREQAADLRRQADELDARQAAGTV